MHYSQRLIYTIALLSSLIGSAFSQTTGGSLTYDSAVKSQFDVNQRIPWTQSNVHGDPDPPERFKTECAFPNLKFVEPIAACRVPSTERLSTERLSTERLCVATREGKIFTFENHLKTSKADLLLDVGKPVYGIAFHPDFDSNGFVFVTSFESPSRFADDGAHLSRFTVKRGSIPKAIPDSEELILTWPSGGHSLWSGRLPLHFCR